MTDDMPAPTLVWFEQDLRVSDHPALTAAAGSGRPVLPVFILDDRSENRFYPGAAALWWLHGSLRHLADALERLGSRLILRRGAPEVVLAALVQETGSRRVLWNRRPERQADGRDAALVSHLARLGVASEQFDGALLFRPESVRTGAGQPFKVFTPFWKECRRLGDPDRPVPAPTALPAPARWPDSDRLADWALRPTAPDWAGGLRASWTPGEAGARARLERFLDQSLARYKDGRNRPDWDLTSGLSPHLRWGELSPRQVWHAVRLRAALPGAPGAGDEGAAEAFLRQLGWRDFSYHQLLRQPSLRTEPLDARFAAFPWSDDRHALKAWQKGRTGYPIVDAGMRQLWQTGWMHNRLRMIVGSFLVKDLLLPWRAGEAWFWDTLVDADPGNNPAGWQWIAGCGADAAPYFRIFNPVLQGRKFDPDGAFVRRFVPELASLPAEHIHEPWTAPGLTLRQAGVRLGQTYPAPMVDHKHARAQALAAFEHLKADSSPRA